MPEISYSIGELSKVVKSCVEAFDALYSTLKRVALDGWSGIATVIREIKNSQDESVIREFIIHLRRLQVSKIQISSALVNYMSESVRMRRNRLAIYQLWDQLERDLEKLLEVIGQQQSELKEMTNVAIPMVLGEKFQEYVTGLSVRAQRVAHLVDRESVSDQQLNELVDLLDREAKLIGKCADSLTEYMEHRRKELAGS